MEHIIRQYSLEAGALEAQYIEEYFTEFRGKKTAEEIIDRLKDREHLILVSMAPSNDDGTLSPVAYKIGHELRSQETNIQDRKSTRLNSSHVSISYAVFCLKK